MCIPSRVCGGTTGSPNPERQERAREGYARNAEKRRAAKRKEYAENSDKIKARNNAYYARTKETRRERYRALNRKNYANHAAEVCAGQKRKRGVRRAEFIRQIAALLKCRDIPGDAEPVGVVYKIENSVTHRVYIGQTTVALDQRYKTPFYLQREKLRNKLVAEDLNLHGKNSFSKPLAIYACYSKEELDMAEAYFIDKFNSVEFGYNVTHGIRFNKAFRPSADMAINDIGRVGRISKP